MRRPGPRFSWNRTLSSWSLLILAGSAAGCYSAGDGIAPPLDRIYFPVGLALTGGARHLVVANSDFDLQYNAGSLGVLAVDAFAPEVPVPCLVDRDCEGVPGRAQCDNVRRDDNPVPSLFCVADAAAPNPCGNGTVRPEANRLLHPGRCQSLDPVSFYSDKVEIGAFATDVVYRARPDAAESGRLFVPVRGDATLHWLDIDESGRIRCGQENHGGSCDDVHRAGDNPDQENTRNLRLSPEPYGLDISSDAQAVLVTNQTSGQVSLFRNDWGANPEVSGGVNLEFVVTNLPSRPIAVAALPTPAVAQVRRFSAPFERTQTFPPGFLLTFRNAPEIDLIRYFNDVFSNPIRPYATRPNAVPITVNSSGGDSRGLAIDGTARRAAENVCLEAAGQSPDCLGRVVCLAPKGADLANCTEKISECLVKRTSADEFEPLAAEEESSLSSCLEAAAPTPLDVFVASRSPSSLLVGRTTPGLNALENTDIPAFYDSVPLTTGPSRVTTGNIVTGNSGEEPTLERRVFVSCFDSRRVFVYDPQRRAVDVEVVTGRGPYAMAVDEVHHWLFIAHFTDSYIGVVSLDRRFPQSYGKMLATIGEPNAPRASK